MEAVVLASGAKGLFEDPGFLIGVPLLALGALGALIALTPVEIKWPSRPETVPSQVEAEADEGHPEPATYVKVGLWLGVITAIEVAIFYVDLIDGLLIGLLLALSLGKFLLVALWFMHLQFDSRLFSTLFTGGMALAVALFIVVLATLGANLV